ncbi:MULTISPECIES: hypothetical protein [unclassified Cellulophaga]|uniref:hypothetical protein n=1 Tax=unclassified Cellulophaga TaxID=2634405 RepID=UPI0026E39405|nr:MULTISPECIES: hypothetical protein [unclassified Cellulophaga]MDO6492229.1 hypothetical protein [Cellulophaga sp. 2_MG-2023]MDO6493179.1 hypothetical protein [Cellulophaga sp. 3_MG-2023]
MSKKKPISKIIYVFAALLSIWATILIFQRLFLNDMDYYNPYNNELVFPLFICLFYISLCMWLIPKMKNKIFRNFIFIISPLLLISYAFFDIADSNKIEFGTTWTASEVFIELVYSKTFFIPLLLIGMSLNFIVNLWYYNSKAK